MTTPLYVDPADLAAVGAAIGSDGDAAAAAVDTLGSALSDAGAMFGHDAAGIVFGQGYLASGKALLEAAATAVNACRRVGFGVQTSAANYGRANGSSTVGGATSSTPPPTAPSEFSAPSLPPLLGGGIAAPFGWTLVEAFVGGVWPDGNPGELHAAAGAWRSFGAATGDLAQQVNSAVPSVSAHRIPEAEQVISVLGQIVGGLTDIGTQAQTLAALVDGFADTVDATQNAVRNLVYQLSPVGIFDTIGDVFTGDDPFAEIRAIADEITVVIDNMKREADAASELFDQCINVLDSSATSLETWAKAEFTNAFGRTLGGVLSDYFDGGVDVPEGGLKFVVETAEGLLQLDPVRFVYDPAGAKKTWAGMAKTTSQLVNPAFLASNLTIDPAASLEALKGLVDWKDVEAGHPLRALGYDAAQVAAALIPGVGEAEPVVIEGRVAAAEARAAAAGARGSVQGLARAGSVADDVTAQAGRIRSNLANVELPKGAAAGGSVPTGRAPVGDGADAAPKVAAPEGVSPRADAPPDSRPVWSDREHEASVDGDTDIFEEGAGPDGRLKFSGHGSYDSADGETVVPEGSSVTVYAEHGSSISDALGNAIETGGDTSHVYSHTYHAGEVIPNYTLHPPDGLDIHGDPWTVDASTTLSDILVKDMGDIDFAACLYDPDWTQHLVYDLDGIWDEMGRPTHIYESPGPEGSWDGGVLDDHEWDDHGVSQSYDDVQPGTYTDAPGVDQGDLDGVLDDLDDDGF